MDTIRLTGMRFFALVGDLPHEREIPQPIVVDLEVRTDLSRAAATDDLDEGVDYRDLHAAVAETMSEDAREAPHLLETLGERIAGRVLAIEAGMTILLDEPEVVALADKLGISIVSLNADEVSLRIAA